jgi:lysozyme family protein
VSDFPRALPIILEEEGGFYDGSQPWDANVTMHGVTQARYDQYLASVGADSHSVEQITDNEVETIYLVDYWQPSHADALPWPLSLFHFDFFVNTTPERAIAALQRTVNRTSGLTITVDGQWGPETAAAVSHGLAMALAPRTLLLERLLEYEDIVKHEPVKATPLWKEWIPRVATLYQRYT